MIKTLYHWTDKVAGRRILSEGFEDGRDGEVWLAEHPKEALGEFARQCLLRLTIDAEPDTLALYEAPVEDEEVFDSESNQFVSASGSEREYQGVTFYGIPSAILIPLIQTLEEVSRKELGEANRRHGQT